MLTLILLLVALAVTMIVLERVTRGSLRRGSRQIVDKMKTVYSGAHEYREVSLDQFPYVDRSFYEKTSASLAAEGFQFLGDVENLTMSAAGPLKATPIRAMVGEQSTVMAGIYHGVVGLKTALLLLGQPRSFRVVDLESAFEDGRFLITSTAQRADGIDDPPDIESEYHDPATPVRELLARHRHRLASLAGDTRCLKVSTLGDLLRAQERLQAIKTDFHRAKGWRLSAKELARIARDKDRQIYKDLEREMARPDDDSDRHGDG